jgi:exodeoxyribonuclease VII small subunit
VARKKEKFEEALQKLEAIVAKMEEGDLPLEEALKAFEEGVKLAKFCTGKLDEAERKVEKLIRDQAGRIQTTPFAEEEDDS